MIKKIALFTLILIGTTGCNAVVETLTREDVSAPQPIERHSSIPDGLIVPSYPEELDDTTVKEYDNGYEVILTVPNPYAVARAAWIQAYQEQLWQVENEVVISENSISWVIMKKDEQILFIKIEALGNEQSILTTFIKK